MSTDGPNKLLVEMPGTDAVDKYSLATNGKTAGYWYDSPTLFWAHDTVRMDSMERLKNEESTSEEIHPMVVAGDGNSCCVFTIL